MNKKPNPLSWNEAIRLMSLSDRSELTSEEEAELINLTIKFNSNPPKKEEST